MIKTILFSFIIIIVLNYLIHYLKDMFTKPKIQYIVPEKKEDFDAEAMKAELVEFLS
uniref:Uncharacterized protein n=1 Tax=viral metagenome TaxID=1070528 RepID=A0A6C0HRD4_9ZZZZ